MRESAAPSAIRAENIGKRYRLGQRQAAYSTLVESLATGAAALRHRLAQGARPRPALEPELFWALQDVSFEIGRGEVIGIIGSNGAGKSTLLKILSRITEPTQGQVEIRGRLGSLLEVGTGFHQELTGRENIYLNGAILGMKRAEIEARFDEIVAFAEIDGFLDTAVKYYSSGMYLRLAFAVAAHLDPEILLIDEVLAVGDAAFQRKCLGKMGSVAERGRTVLFVSHNMTAIQAMCQRVIWLRHGRIAADGEAAQVISAYLRETSRGCTEQSWNDQRTAPGNDRVRLRRARVRPHAGSPSDTISVRTPFLVELEYWNLQPGARLSLGLRLTNGHGVLVFYAGPTAPPRPLAAGLFRDVCRIPADLLNDGSYQVEIVVQDKEQVILCQRDVLTFDVLDSAELRGGWYGQWSGIIRPMLEWTTQPIAVGSPPEIA